MSDNSGNPPKGQLVPLTGQGVQLKVELVTLEGQLIERGSIGTNASIGNTDMLTLQVLLANLEKTANDFMPLSLESSAYLGVIAKARGALGDIREQLVPLEERAKGLENALWEGMWRNGPDGLYRQDDPVRVAYGKANAIARELRSRIGALAWDLFDFRRRDG